MKKLLLALTIAPMLLVAQTEKINFTKKLTYFDTSERDLQNANLYYSPQGIFIESPNKSTKYLLKSNLMGNISVDLDKNIGFNGGYYSSGLDSIPTFKFKKLSEKDAIGDYNCTYYLLTNTDKYRYDEDIKMCIKEDPTLDVISIFNNNTEDKVKGYPVLVSLGYGKKIILKNIQNTNQSVSLNNFKEQVGKMIVEKEHYKDEYDYDYSSVDSTEAVTEGLEEDSYYTYKEVSQEEMNLAIDQLEEDYYYWKKIPQYCKNLSVIIPEFKNEEVKKHAKNYAGQICDLYLFFTGYPGVADKETLDAIRYEEDYFRNNKLDKKDQKLLTDFLNSLD